MDKATVKSASTMPLSPSSTCTSATDADAVSSLTIVPVASALAISALTGLLSVNVNVSSRSGRVSPITGTEMVRSVSPGANRSSPLVAS